MSEFWSQKFETGYYDKILQNGLIKNRGLQPGWHNITFLKLKKYVLLESVHLDYACGPGTFIGAYIKNDSIGIDLSKNQISYAKDKYGKYGKFFSISDSDISNYKNHFDVITIAGLLEFLTIKDAIQLISNLQKSLKKDGRIILTTPNYGGFFSVLQKIVYLYQLYLLRFLEIGHEVKMIKMSDESISVDTKKNLYEVVKKIKSKNRFNKKFF